MCILSPKAKVCKTVNRTMPINKRGIKAMKIHIPAYEPSLECTERLRHGEIDIDLGEDVVRVVFCRDCSVPHNKWTGCPNLNGLIPPPNFYCAYGERKDKV